jgi:hypothetical protein
MANVLFRRGTQEYINNNVPISDGQVVFNETDEAIYVDSTINGSVVRKRYAGGNLSRSDIDMTLSTTSENPVANKVVTNAIGDLPSLQTDVKTNLVGAINEVNAHADTAQSNIDAEATARANADSTLQNNIDAEATARQTADNTLQGNINSEASTRASADSNLQSQINQIVAPSGEAPSAAEVQNARIGADGVTYDTLGDAIRGQVADLKSAFKKIASDEDSNLLDTVTVSLDTYVNKMGVESSNDSFCSYKNINVENYVGQRLYVNGTGLSTVLRAVSYYNASGTYIDGLENVANGGYVIPPVLAKYMTVSVPYLDRPTKSVPTDLYVSNNVDGSDNVNLTITGGIRKEVREVRQTMNLVEDKPIVPRYGVNGASYNSSDYFFCVRGIKVSPNIRYYIHCDGSARSWSSGKDARFITEYDSSGNVLRVVQNIQNTYYSDNANIDHIDITFFYLEPYPTANTGFYYFSQYPLTENTRLLNNTDRVYMKQLSDLDVFYEQTRKATICFSFDDGVTQDSQIVDAFDEAGAKCGFALISSILSDNAGRIAYYRDLYNRGYSILCHSNNGDNMGNETSYTESQLLVKMRDTKVGFEKFGIKISGWVTPSSFMKADYVPTLAKFYNYGYTRYFGAYTDLTRIPYDDLSNSGYFLKRVHIGTTSIANLKEAVDETIANNGLLSLYGHAYELDDDTLDIAKLKELLIYIKAHEHDDLCHLYAPDEAMIYYFRPRHGE